MDQMVQWTIIVLLYAFGMGAFGLLGGLSSAGEAFRRWGESAAAKRDRATPGSGS
jgi:hypothetical protein